MPFPSSLPSYAGFISTQTLQAASHAAQHNQEQADILGLAEKIGTGNSTPTPGVTLLGIGTGTSAWGQLSLNTGVNGVLPTNNGGTGTTSTSGVGAVVFNTNANLNNPQTVSLDNVSGATNAGGLINTGGLTTDTLITTGAIGGTGLSGAQQTSTGGGVGTFWYSNTGGVKEFWGSVSAVTTGSFAVITFPPSFFSAIQVATVTAGTISGTAAVEAVVGNSPSLTTTSMSATLTASAGSGTMPVQVFVRGT